MSQAGGYRTGVFIVGIVPGVWWVLINLNNERYARGVRLDLLDKNTLYEWVMRVYWPKIYSFGGMQRLEANLLIIYFNLNTVLMGQARLTDRSVHWGYGMGSARRIIKTTKIFISSVVPWVRRRIDWISFGVCRGQGGLLDQYSFECCMGPGEDWLKLNQIYFGVGSRVQGRRLTKPSYSPYWCMEESGGLYTWPLITLSFLSLFYFIFPLYFSHLYLSGVCRRFRGAAADSYII